MPEPAPVITTTLSDRFFMRGPRGSASAAAVSWGGLHAGSSGAVAGVETSYAAGSKRLRSRRNVKVARDQSTVLRPWASRYQLAQPPCSTPCGPSAAAGRVQRGLGRGARLDGGPAGRAHRAHRVAQVGHLRLDHEHDARSAPGRCWGRRARRGSGSRAPWCPCRRSCRSRPRCRPGWPRRGRGPLGDGQVGRVETGGHDDDVDGSLGAVGGDDPRRRDPRGGVGDELDVVRGDGGVEALEIRIRLQPMSKSGVSLGAQLRVGDRACRGWRAPSSAPGRAAAGRRVKPGT